MTISIKKQTETITRNVCVSVTCDLCGTIDPLAKLDGELCVSWACRGIQETCCKINQGIEGFTELTTYHICPLCFQEKLIPWLNNNGAKPTTQKVSW